jgi:hypothetical protein
VVDIQIKLSTLLCLDDDPGIIPGWGPVIADIARQIATDPATPPAWAYSVTDEHGRLLHHGQTRRRPSAAEAAHITARDRTCRAPGCTRAAIACDLDHHREQAHDGGPAHRGNLCALCRHHHRLRHELGHRLHHIHPEVWVWETPTGRMYLIPPSGDLLPYNNAAPGTGHHQLYPLRFNPGPDHDGPPPPGHARAACGTGPNDTWD